MVVGSVVLFYLYLFLLSRWTASATSYVFLLFPVATAPMAALVLGEHVTVAIRARSIYLALVGVWLGAIWNPAPEPSAVRAREQPLPGGTLRSAKPGMRLDTQLGASALRESTAGK